MLSGTNFQSNVKSVVVSAWKERWPIKKWTSTARRTLQSGSLMEVQHMAEVLFAQAFVGSSPNTVLLNYFHYSLQTSLFTYAAVLSAISRHENLQNIDSKKCILKLVDICIKDLNSGQILEDCIPLCRALLALLKWLLRNIEQYLKGVKDVSLEDCNEIVQISCKTLENLTQSIRTSSLMTVARFEESSVWSHIETDLAVIKNAAGQHTLQAEVSRSCHHVSQLSRLHMVRSNPLFQIPNNKNLHSTNDISINIQIMLENDPNTEPNLETLVIDLLTTAKICNLSLNKLLLDIIRTCILAHLDARKTPQEQKWLTVFYISLPKYLLAIKKNIPLIVDQGDESHFKSSEFENDLISALTTICKFDGLINAVDIGNSKLVSCFDILIKKFIQYELVSEEKIKIFQDMQTKQWNKIKQNESDSVTGLDPNKSIKAENTAQQLLKMLDAQKYSTQKDEFVLIFNKICNSMDVFFSTAFANGCIVDYTQKIILLNNVVKSCTAENSASALSRSVLFDQTFFMICHIAKENGKHTVTNLTWQGVVDQVPFLYCWVYKYWPENSQLCDKNKQQKSLQLTTDPNRVEKLIKVLQAGSEIDSQLKKWDDLCTNMPEALYEMIKAWKCNAITEESIIRACHAINTGVSFSLCLSCAAYLAKKASNASNIVQDMFYLPVIQKLLCKPQSNVTPQDDTFAQRFTFYENMCNYLVKYYLPDAVINNKKPVRKELYQPSACTLNSLLNTTCQNRWISFSQLQEYKQIFKLCGPRWFCQQLIINLLSHTRKDTIEQTTTILLGLFQLQMENLTICLLCYDIPHFLTNEDDYMMLSDPGGTALAKLTVACLGIVLNRLSNQQKNGNGYGPSLKNTVAKALIPKAANNIFLHHSSESMSSSERPNKLRRLMSSTTEHDLSSNNFSWEDGSNFKQSSQREPIFQALNYCLDVMNSALQERRPGPQTNFILQFINRLSHAGELVSQAVLHLMDVSMISELTMVLASRNKSKHNTCFTQDFDNIKFILAISDLGDSKGRKIAAQSICETNLQSDSSTK